MGRYTGMDIIKCDIFFVIDIPKIPMGPRTFNQTTGKRNITSDSTSEKKGVRHEAETAAVRPVRRMAPVSPRKASNARSPATVSGQ